MTGVRRRPILDNEIYSQIQAGIWKATQHSRTDPNSHYGEDFYLDKLKMGRWTPDVLLWAQTMCDTNAALRKTSKLAEPSKPAEPKPKPTTPSALACFYGHLATSSTTSQGKQIWRRSPKTAWPNVPPGRILCQRCYQAHSIAASQGTSQHTFEHLFTKNQSQTQLPPTPVTISQSKPNPVSAQLQACCDAGGDMDMRCEVCAVDCIELSISHERELHWYRLAFCSFSGSTARPPG